MRTRFAAAAALAASILLVLPGSQAGAASSGVVPAGRPAWATLDHAVAVVGGAGVGRGSVSVTEGTTGFPVAVTPAGAVGSAGSVPGGDCVAVAVHGRQVAAGRADDRGRFAVQGPVPRGAIATIRWAPCTSSTDQRHCHNTTPHERNPNRDEAPTDGQGCSTAGDAGPDS